MSTPKVNCWARMCAHGFQRKTGMQVEYKEDVEPTRWEGQKRMLPRMRAKGRMDAPTTDGGIVSCWRLVVKGRVSTQNMEHTTHK